jgi:hypothetical protein
MLNLTIYLILLSVAGMLRNDASLLHKIITKVFIKLLTLRGKFIKQSAILIIQYQTSMMLDNLNRK